MVPNVAGSSPVIRPIIKKHPNGVFFVEKIRVLWYNARIQRTTLVVFFLLPAFAGIFYGEKNDNTKIFTGTDIIARIRR